MASQVMRRAAAMVTSSGSALRQFSAAASASASSSVAGGSSASNDPLSKLVRFQGFDGESHFGILDALEANATVYQQNPETGKMSPTSRSVPIDVLLPPVDPPAIFCIGLNYADHAAEVKADIPTYPLVFTKTINTLTGHNSAIVIPKVASDPPEVDYEAELAVVIGRDAKNVTEEEALDYVLGYTIANDVTARRWQGKKGGGQFTRGKCFDTFLPLGPFLIPKSQVPDPQKLSIRTWVNTDLVQDSNTSQMIFSVAKIIAFLSQGTTLLPGTVICTGTPAGVGYTRGIYLQPGDTVRVSIEGMGTLRNVVTSE